MLTARFRPLHAVLAFDRASVRSVDADGHMRIGGAVLSEACVSPYLGSEIPNAGRLGLSPDRVYRLLRGPDELAKAAASFRGKPLLSGHTALSAATHPHDDVVGSVGSDVTFQDPYLRGSLTIWSDDAVAGVESSEQRGISCAYRFTAVMQPGVFRGQPYDGQMIGLSANHVALVPEPRVASAIVGDSNMADDPDDDEINYRDDWATQLFKFLDGKISADDMTAVEQIVLNALGVIGDDPPPTEGTPVSPNTAGAPRLYPFRGAEQAQDSRSRMLRLAQRKREARAFAKRFPDAPPVRTV